MFTQDLKYRKYNEIKNKYLNTEYEKTNLYNEIKKQTVILLNQNKTLSNTLMYSDLFKKTNNKTLTEYTNELKARIIELEKQNIYIMNEINRYINILENKFKDIPKENIQDIFYTAWIFEKYNGLLFEYKLIEELKNNGFIVYDNEILDKEYKVDLLVTHINSNKAIAIQSKSYTFLGCSNTIKINYINGLNKIKTLGYEGIKNIEVRFILHNGLNLNGIHNKGLLNIFDIMDNIGLCNINIDSLINELNQVLKVN